MSLSVIFRNLCKLFIVIFIILLLSPLATMSFNALPYETQTTTAPVTEQVNSNSYILTSEMSIDENQTAIHGKILYDSLTVDERQNNNFPIALPKINPFYGDKVVYLTFDDGPDPINTPQVLKILKSEEIKATFFVVGTEIEKYPELLAQIYKEGHAIGNHTYSHKYKEIYRSPETYISQLKKNDDVIMNVLHVRPRITRAPGGPTGSFNKYYWSQLKENGYIDICWNISSGDASGLNAAEIVTNTARQLKENQFLWSHSIVLMHDGTGHAETVKALPSIIKMYKDQGFEFQIVNIETPPAW